MTAGLALSSRKQEGVLGERFADHPFTLTPMSSRTQTGPVAVIVSGLPLPPSFALSQFVLFPVLPEYAFGRASP
jgi:hypothetical protein